MSLVSVETALRLLKKRPGEGRAPPPKAHVLSCSEPGQRGPQGEGAAISQHPQASTFHGTIYSAPQPCEGGVIIPFYRRQNQIQGLFSNLLMPAKQEGRAGSHGHVFWAHPEPSLSHRAVPRYSPQQMYVSGGCRMGSFRFSHLPG